MPWPATEEELPLGVQNDTDAETGEPNPTDYAAAGGTDPEGKGDHAKRHNDLADAVNRVFTELGTNPSGAQSSVRARLEALDIVVAAAGSSISAAQAAIEAEKVRAEAAEALKLAKASNLSDLANIVTARANLGTAAYDPFDLLPYIIPMGFWPFTTIEPTAARGYWHRFTVSRKREIKFVRFVVTAVGSAEDKVDVGIFKVKEGTKFERLGSSGAVKTTTNATGVKALELTGTVTCEPGIAYWAGMGFETHTGTSQVAAMNNNGGFYGDIGGTTLANRIQLFKAASIPFGATIETFGGGTPVPWIVPSES